GRAGEGAAAAAGAGTGPAAAAGVGAGDVAAAGAAGEAGRAMGAAVGWSTGPGAAAVPGPEILRTPTTAPTASATTASSAPPISLPRVREGAVVSTDPAAPVSDDCQAHPVGALGP